MLKMAAATAWAAALYKDQQPLCWINLGIAGHQSLEVGSRVLAGKISMPGQAREYHLLTQNSQDWVNAPLISFAQQQHEYHDTAMVDMEGYAFIDTASHFTDIKWCQSIKVISDNATSQAHRNKPAISRLIADHMPAIRDFANKLHHSSQSVTCN